MKSTLPFALLVAVVLPAVSFAQGGVTASSVEPKLPYSAAIVPVDPKLPYSDPFAPVDPKLLFQEPTVPPRLPVSAAMVPVDPKLPYSDPFAPVDPKQLFQEPTPRPRLPVRAAMVPVDPKLPYSDPSGPVDPKQLFQEPTPRPRLPVSAAMVPVDPKLPYSDPSGPARLAFQEPMVPPKLPFQEPQLTAWSRANERLAIRHDSVGTEYDTMPAGTMFAPLAKGPKCPHWPGEGCGAQYAGWQDPAGLEFHYSGWERARALRDQAGQIGPHESWLFVRAPTFVPAVVDVSITSLIDANWWKAFAVVEVVGYQTIVHSFVPTPSGLGETSVSVPVHLGCEGLSIYVRTWIHVDNKVAPTFQGLVDMQTYVTVRLPLAEYSVGGTGCAGSNGVPELVPMGLPVLGETFAVEVRNLPLDPAKPAVGLLDSERLVPALALGPFGMAGCELHVWAPQVVPLVKSAGSAVWRIPIALDLSLVDARFYQQVFALDEPWVNGLGAVVSNYGEAKIGVTWCSSP